MQPHSDRLQLLPQPALPEVPGCGRKGVAGGARERAIAGPVLHGVFSLPSQIADIAYQNKGRDLRSVVQGVIRGDEKRVKGVEDLNICIIGAQGIVGVGAITPMCT